MLQTFQHFQSTASFGNMYAFHLFLIFPWLSRFFVGPLMPSVPQADNNRRVNMSLSPKTPSTSLTLIQVKLYENGQQL